MAFWKKIETWYVRLSCQYTHFMSFSSKSEHDTIADQATLMLGGGVITERARNSKCAMHNVRTVACKTLSNTQFSPDSMM